MLTQEDKLTFQIDGTNNMGHYYLQEGSLPISNSPPIRLIKFQQKLPYWQYESHMER